MKKIFLTGATGQDGSYLVDDALKKGEEVHAILRRSSSFNTARIDHVLEHPSFFRYYGDLTDANVLAGIVAKVQPDEIYHLGAQSHVKVSFDSPGYSVDSIVTGTLNMLEAFRHHCPTARFYNAASSEMFGEVQEIPQKETTPFYPRSPYACAKVAAYWLTVNYRESYGLHASNGILFNHESPRRGETFVTRKITRAISNIVHAKQDRLRLGNLDAMRDWGFSPDYVEAMRLMLQQEKPDDYVIATGETHSVADFVNEAFRIVGLDPRQYIVIDPKYFRPTEVAYLRGDATKAKEKLGWEPKVKFKELVKIMVEADLK